MPDEFYNYVDGKASRVADLSASKSDRQLRNAFNAIKADLNRVDTSDSVKVLHLDIALKAQRNSEES